MTTIIVKAYAKINLMLRVSERRPDGYHNVKTLMQEIDLFDTVRLRLIKNEESPPDGIILKCRWSDNAVQEPAPEINLAYKAALSLKRYLDERDGVEITLTKRIPAGAGLGGGSSDAAAVLRGLCRLWKRNPPQKTLDFLAAKLGADVAFFLKGGCCLAEGMGEKITPLKTSWDKNKLWVVLVKPRFSTSTKEIYCKLDEVWKKTNGTGARDSDTFSGKIKAGNILKLSDIDFVNDLEPVVVEMHPEIEKIKKRIGIRDALVSGAGAVAVMMSGSGSSVFGIFEERKSAISSFNAVRKSYPSSFLVKTVS